MKTYIILMMVLFAGCGSTDLITLPSLSSLQPQVISVAPKANSTVGVKTTVTAKFSRQVDKETVRPETVLLIAGYEEKPAVILEKEIKDGKVKGVEGERVISEDELSVTIRPESDLSSGEYAFVITRGVSSKDLYPIKETSVFCFNVSDNVQDLEYVSDDTSSETLISDDVEEPSVNAVPPPAVVINELLYDAEGSDTDGNLFIELKGTPEGNLSGYKINFINGDDGKTTGSISIQNGGKIPTDGILVIADTKTNSTTSSNVVNVDILANFDPQNGPDAAQLLNAKGELIDALCYGETAVKTAENGLAMCEGYPAPDVSSGESLGRPMDKEDSGDNLSDFVVMATPTPGI